jgi:hypothetical protein
MNPREGEAPAEPRFDDGSASDQERLTGRFALPCWCEAPAEPRPGAGNFL